jgi:hypothetical protein
VELLDEAIEQLYRGRRRVCRAPGKGHPTGPIEGADPPAGGRRGQAG